MLKKFKFFNNKKVKKALQNHKKYDKIAML